MIRFDICLAHNASLQWAGHLPPTQRRADSILASHSLADPPFLFLAIIVEGSDSRERERLVPNPLPHSCRMFPIIEVCIVFRCHEERRGPVLVTRRVVTSPFPCRFGHDCPPAGPMKRLDYTSS